MVEIHERLHAGIAALAGTFRALGRYPFLEVWMKNPVMSFWLSSANQVASWWMGHAANAMRAQQRLVLDEMTKAATGAKPRRKRRIRKSRAAVRRS